MNEADYLPLPKDKIYKYTSLEGALATIRNGTFKFSRPLDFNDPFDCNVHVLKYSRTQSSLAILKLAVDRLPWTRLQKRKYSRELTSPVRFESFFKRLAEQRIESAKVTCFSKKFTNTVMWSHYADNHKGVCLEFNASLHPSAIIVGRPDAMILNVNYEKTDLVNLNVEDGFAFLDLFTRKSSDWKYEEEVRIIISKGDVYHEFNKDFLTGVTFGCRTSTSDKQLVLEAIRARGYKVDVQCAKRGNFQLEFEPCKM